LGQYRVFSGQSKILSEIFQAIENIALKKRADGRASFIRQEYGAI
jgi:hypothetical protein